MILLIDNYDSFTWNLVQRLGELDAGLDVRVVRNDKITADTVPAASEWEVSAWTSDVLDDGSRARVVMGLRSTSFGPAPVEGVQFHPESYLTDAGPRLLANFLGLAHAATIDD